MEDISLKNINFDEENGYSYATLGDLNVGDPADMRLAVEKRVSAIQRWMTSEEGQVSMSQRELISIGFEWKLGDKEALYLLAERWQEWVSDFIEMSEFESTLYIAQVLFFNSFYGNVANRALSIKIVSQMRFPYSAGEMAEWAHFINLDRSQKEAKEACHFARKSYRVGVRSYPQETMCRELCRMRLKALLRQ